LKIENIIFLIKFSETISFSDTNLIYS